MNAPPEGERRHSSRHEVFLQLVAEEFSPPGTSAFAPRIHGETRNLSSSGLCVVLDHRCHDAALLLCEILVNGCPVAIPTLARVRWVQSNHQSFLAGCEFLLH